MNSNITPHKNITTKYSVLIFVMTMLQVKTFKTQNLNKTLEPSQPTITCSKLTKETLEKGVKHVQS